MGLIQLFTQKGNFVEEIEFDAVLEEGATTSSRITSNPVEYGADVNDHRIFEPMRFSLTGITSNTVLSSVPLLAVADQALALLQDKTRSQQLWDELLDLQKRGDPFILVQGLREYKDVVIESLSYTHDADSANSLQFGAEMKQIVYAGGSGRSITFIDDNVSDKSSPATSSGGKSLA